MVDGSQTGMQGVFLVAAELTFSGFIVSVTSRNAFGADLLVTDKDCLRAYSIQVKTNHRAASFWLLSAHAVKLKSDSHLYVFVNLKGNQRPDFYYVNSRFISENVDVEPTKGGIWYSIAVSKIKENLDAWRDALGDPGPIADKKSIQQ